MADKKNNFKSNFAHWPRLKLSFATKQKVHTCHPHLVAICSNRIPKYGEFLWGSVTCYYRHYHHTYTLHRRGTNHLLNTTFKIYVLFQANMAVFFESTPQLAVWCTFKEGVFYTYLFYFLRWKFKWMHFNMFSLFSPPVSFILKSHNVEKNIWNIHLNSCNVYIHTHIHTAAKWILSLPLTKISP